VEFNLLGLLSLVVLPFTLWSVWYQWKVAKTWCPLCLGVVAVLWVEAILSLFALQSGISFPSPNREGLGERSNFSILVVSALALLPTALYTWLKPLITKSQKLPFTTQALLVNLVKLLNPKSKYCYSKKATADIQQVKEVFDKESLATGALLLATAANNLNGTATDKKFIFARSGLSAWISGYAVQYITDGYGFVATYIYLYVAFFLVFKNFDTFRHTNTCKFI
jgi:hypothetical protein